MSLDVLSQQSRKDGTEKEEDEFQKNHNNNKDLT